MKHFCRALAVIMCTLTSGVHAQQTAKADPSDKPLFLAGVQYGRPLRVSAGLAVFVPTSEPHLALREGFLIEGGAGQSGARVSVGLARFLEYMGLDARAVLTRTWKSPRGATTDSTYGGAEGGVSIAYVRVSAGVAHRLAGAAGPDATIFTWSAGLQFPFVR